jgi:hypothetical protein
MATMRIFLCERKRLDLAGLSFADIGIGITPVADSRISIGNCIFTRVDSAVFGLVDSSSDRNACIGIAGGTLAIARQASLTQEAWHTKSPATRPHVAMGPGSPCHRRMRRSSGNWLHDCEGAAISISSASPNAEMLSRDIQIANNGVDGCDDVELTGTADSLVKSNELSSRPGSGIPMPPLELNNTLRWNRIVDSSGHGIRMDAAEKASNNTICDIILIGNNGAWSSCDALHLQALESEERQTMWATSSSGQFTGNCWGDLTGAHANRTGLVDRPDRIADGVEGQRPHPSYKPFQLAA